jgi:hypothetical protein
VQKVLGKSTVKCGKKENIVGKNTSNFLKHLKTSHPMTYGDWNKKRGNNSLTYAGSGSTSKTETGQKSIYEYVTKGNCKILLQPEVQNALVRMIVESDLPFTFVEENSFKIFLATILGPENVIKNLMSRKQIKEKIMLSYAEEKAKLVAKLFKINSKIAVTLDMWTSKNQYCFMGITGHFINSAWKLEKIVLGFKQVVGDHSGENQVLFLNEVLDELGIR